MITDLSPLAQLEHLKELDLSAPLDFVNSLEPLRELPNLEKLYVPDHSINTIKPIYNLERLKILSIARTEVPGYEIEEFKKLHPNCDVWS
jgi:Leucine-rich repeat (LRR) protein